MGWRDLLGSSGPEEITLPWAGGRRLSDGKRFWKIGGKLPREHGWYVFSIGGGREATVLKQDEYGPDEESFPGVPKLIGYLTGSRFIRDDARVDPDPNKLVDQTEQVYLIERGLERFTRAVVVRLDDRLYYLRQEFPNGPEYEVQAAYEDGKDSVDSIKGVTPALDLAFRWEFLQRKLAEERERERERLEAEAIAEVEEEERYRQALKDAGTGAGRRALALRNFKAAATAALAISGAEYLDHREGLHPNEMVVDYKCQDRRLQCVCDRDTLRIIDAGVCLVDHATGERGDTYLTLESLPATVGQAIRERKLVVWRHVAGDREDGWDDGEDY